MMNVFAPQLYAAVNRAAVNYHLHPGGRFAAWQRRLAINPFAVAAASSAPQIDDADCHKAALRAKAVAALAMYLEQTGDWDHVRTAWRDLAAEVVESRMSTEER